MEFGLRRRYCALCNVVVDVLTLMICSHSSLSFFSHSFYPRLTPFMLTFWFGIKKKKKMAFTSGFACCSGAMLINHDSCNDVLVPLCRFAFCFGFGVYFVLCFFLPYFLFCFSCVLSLSLSVPFLHPALSSRLSACCIHILLSKPSPLDPPASFSLPPLTTGFNRPLLSPPTSSQPSPTYPSIHTPDETTPGLAEGRTQMAVLKALRRSWARYTIGGRIPRRFSDGASESWKRRFLVSLFIFFLWFMGIFICLFLYSLRHIVVVGILLSLFFLYQNLFTFPGLFLCEIFMADCMLVKCCMSFVIEKVLCSSSFC